MWECLYLHTIPIVEDSLFARQFAGMIVHETEGGETFCSYTVEVLGPSLPVLLVSDWSSVQLCVLERAWELALSMEWDWEVLTMSRWKNFIRSHTREGQ
ncbi:hypothetical protein GUITHDRAFT_155564 [Guillardia theta CCMP2712]|nr:hypothetical protein GUITHDRAFT_155564 [Guillardia theta CCMP2712]EKX35119.1 hypothetical protein GUITHDRAFT_155564 [Guillardia theta CCMP2712]|eukprot:XP_005822099.1 hypothetical protein GUITHDRAFT_155564 [Guillardia theta CCMP2712]